jgi:hypothetical protein
MLSINGSYHTSIESDAWIRKNKNVSKTQAADIKYLSNVKWFTGFTKNNKMKMHRRGSIKEQMTRETNG